MTPKIDAKAFARYANDPATFRANLIVDASGVARRFGDVQEEWQLDPALDQALLVCAGRAKKSAMPGVKLRHYAEMPRGHNKTGSLAMAACYVLAFATRPVAGYCFAVDKDQAALLRMAMLTLVRLNPWLGSILDVQKDVIVNVAQGHPAEGSTLTISTSDVASSWGILPSFIICDEFTVWQGDGSLWHSIISSAAKREDCLVMVATNAGFSDSWQHGVVEVIKSDPAWCYKRLDGCQASWMLPRLAELRRMLPAVSFSRLIDNNWSTGGGDALTESVINAAFDDGLRPMQSRLPGWLFVAGVDLGLKRDCSAVVVLAFPGGGCYGKARLAHHRLWRPGLGKKVDLMDVERHLLQLDALFELENIAYDPWQAELLAARLEADTDHRRRNQKRLWWERPWVREVPPTGANLRQQATLVIEAFADRRLEFFPCDALFNDLIKLRCTEKSYGVRLTSPRDGTGHGDTFSAFANALLIGHEVSGQRPVIAGAGFDGRDEDGLSEYQRHMRRVQEEIERIAAEQVAIRNSKPNGLADALREGRVEVFYH